MRSVPTPQLNMGAAGLFDENHILYSNDIYYADKANPIQLYMVDSQNGKTVSKWRGHLEENKKYGMILTSRDFMYNYDNSLFYKPALENVIFKILSPKNVSWFINSIVPAKILMYLLMKLTLRKDFSFYRCIGLRKQLSICL